MSKLLEFFKQICQEILYNLKEPYKPDIQNIQQMPEKQIEAIIQAKYQTHRKLLQDYRKKLDDRNEALIKWQTKLQEKQDDINQRQKTVDEDEKELERQRESYRLAVLNTESKEMDWVKRCEKKEMKLFEEIQDKVVRFDKYSSFALKDGFEFEKYMAVLLEKNHFENVMVTSKSKDFGGDVLAEKNGIKYVFQCKLYTHLVGIDAVQEAHSAKSHYKTHVAVVATNSVFTHSAEELASETNTILWDGKKIESMK